jgi:uncharacterized protein (UPF0371 family)
MRKGFDNKKYLKVQSKKIKERFDLFDKLYLEIGGKLFDDTHASRVLPGFQSDAKINMFKELKNDLEIISITDHNTVKCYYELDSIHIQNYFSRKNNYWNRT